MRRRHLLAVVGSLAAASGCTGTQTNPTPDQTVTPMPVPEQRRDSGQPESFAITGPVVQPGIVYMNTPDSIGIEDDAGQYLRLTVTGDVPPRNSFEFRFDGDSYAPGVAARPPYSDPSIEYEGMDGPIAFGLPETGDATDARLVWPDGEWMPPTTVADRLEAPLPPMSMSLDGPETAAEGAEPIVTVTNEGEMTGRYVAALNRQGPRTAPTAVARLTGELAPGTTETRRVDAVPPEDDRATRYALSTPGRDRLLTHTITESA